MFHLLGRNSWNILCNNFVIFLIDLFDWSIVLLLRFFFFVLYVYDIN